MGRCARYRCQDLTLNRRPFRQESFPEIAQAGGTPSGSRGGHSTAPTGADLTARAATISWSRTHPQ